MRDIHPILRIILIIGIILVIASYAYYKTIDMIRGPILSISHPINGETLDDAVLEIYGKVTNISYISINDRQIFTDEAGIFKEKLILHPGYNIISVKVRDRFERSSEKTLEVVYREKQDDVLDIQDDMTEATPIEDDTIATSTEGLDILTI